jgi:hypothetical protein
MGQLRPGRPQLAWRSDNWSLGNSSATIRDAHYSKQKVTELVPGHKVVWHVVDSKLSGPDDPSEWTGTEVTFEINQQDGQTDG